MVLELITFLKFSKKIRIKVREKLSLRLSSNFPLKTQRFKLNYNHLRLPYFIYQVHSGSSERYRKMLDFSVQENN